MFSSIRLRPASKADRDLLRRLNDATMRDYIVQTYGSWDDEVETRFFEEGLKEADFSIITVDGEDAGCLALAKSQSFIFVREIQLFPAYQGMGIGRRIFASLMAESDIRGIPVILEVLKVNRRARAFYESMGFKQTDGTETHIRMSREPAVGNEKEG